MTKKPKTSKDAADKVVKNIRRKTRQTYSSEEKIRIVRAGLRGEESISVLCRREGIAGHGRVLATTILGLTDVPVIRLGGDYPDQQLCHRVINPMMKFP